MLKTLSNIIKHQSSSNARKCLNKINYIQTNNKPIQNIQQMTNKQTYGYFNIVYKFQVRYNIINLIEDERKVYFFMKIVEKYYDNDIEKVVIGSQEVLRSIKDPKYSAKVRLLLLTSLQKKENPNFFEIIQIRMQLIDDLIMSDDHINAAKHLQIIKNNYKELEQNNTPIFELEALIHQQIISNLQLQNFQEALIFADKLKFIFEKLKNENLNIKDIENKIIPLGISLYSYLWTIYRKGENNYSRAMEQFSNLQKIVQKQQKNLVQFIGPKSLSQFEEFMLDAFQFNLENKEFEKAKDIFEFYIKNFFKNPQKQIEFKNVPEILSELEFNYSHIILASQKIQKQGKVEQTDQDIYAYSVEQYYYLSVLINTCVGIDLHTFKLHDIINKTIVKFSPTVQKRIQSTINKFDFKIKELELQEEIEENKQLNEEQGKQQ